MYKICSSLKILSVIYFYHWQNIKALTTVLSTESGQQALSAILSTMVLPTSPWLRDVDVSHPLQSQIIKTREFKKISKVYII